MKTSALSLFLVLLAGAAEAEPSLHQPESAEIARILDEVAQGRDGLFGQAVAPALSLDSQATPSAGVLQADSRIAQEIDRVLSAFMDAPDGQRPAATRAAVAAIDKQTATDGASRTFEGQGPSLSLMRQLAFVRSDQVQGGEPVARLRDIVSSFERSPKTDDIYFEYSDPRDLVASTIAKLPGSATSWTTGARPAMAGNTLYTLKKCRQVVLLGWFCNTADYAVRDLAASPTGKASVLITVLRPVGKGRDNPAFSGKQAENVVDGYTAVYLFKQAGSFILIYNLGIQSQLAPTSQPGQGSAGQKTAGGQSEATLGFADPLNAGQKAEYRQLLARLSAELGIKDFP